MMYGWSRCILGVSFRVADHSSRIAGFDRGWNVAGAYLSADPRRYAQTSCWTDRPRTLIPALLATWGQANRLQAPTLAKCWLRIRNRTSRRQECRVPQFAPSLPPAVG